MGCATPAEHYDVFIDPAFGSYAHQMIEEGVAEWQTFTGVSIEIHEGSRTCTDYCFDVVPTTRAALGGNLGGLTRIKPGCQCGTIFLATDTDPVDFQVLAIHEMGHMLGLSHHGTNSIMNPEPEAATYWHVACDDVIQYWEIRGRALDISLCTDPRLWETKPTLLNLVGGV